MAFDENSAAKVVEKAMSSNRLGECDDAGIAKVTPVFNYWTKVRF
jgi:hypothetical protein